MSQPHLPLFGILASLDASERNAAALTLIKSLAVLQNAHKTDLDPMEGEITEERLDQLCHPEVVYALKRLLRGLPSDREAARQGFSLALTEVRFPITEEQLSYTSCPTSHAVRIFVATNLHA